MSLIATTALASAAFAQNAPSSLSCQGAAETAAIKVMNKSLQAEKGPDEPLEEAEKAQLTGTVLNLDEQDNEVKQETGIYAVEMSVFEECYDAMKVTTKKVLKGKKMKCEIIKVESFGQRDCG